MYIRTSKHVRVCFSCSCVTDFRQRFVSLLSYSFRSFQPGTALSILQASGQMKKEEQGAYIGGGRGEVHSLYSSTDLHFLYLCVDREHSSSLC